MARYSFCESVTGIGPRHIRKLTSVGRKLGGGIDTPSLCGLVHPIGAKIEGKLYRGGGGWDLDDSVKLNLFNLHHACSKCADEFLKLINRKEPFKFQPGDVACKGCGLPVRAKDVFCNLCMEDKGPEWDEEAKRDGKLPRE